MGTGSEDHPEMKAPSAIDKHSQFHEILRDFSE